LLSNDSVHSRRSLSVCPTSAPSAWVYGQPVHTVCSYKDVFCRILHGGLGCHESYSPFSCIPGNRERFHNRTLQKFRRNSLSACLVPSPPAHCPDFLVNLAWPVVLACLVDPMSGDTPPLMHARLSLFLNMSHLFPLGGGLAASHRGPCANSDSLSPS
jgi:hypothetical protein